MDSTHTHTRPTRQPRLYTAIAERDTARVREYIQAGDSLSHPTEGVSNFTPLQHAIIDGNHLAIQTLRRLGADLNARNSRGMNAMHVAAVYSDNPVIQLLHHLGVSTRSVDVKNHTPLMYAICNERQKQAVCLIRLDPAVIHIRNALQATALMMACMKRFVKVVQVLLEHGARCETQGNVNGLTSLHVAAYQGNRRIMKMLLETEPYQHIRDRRLFTPLHLAMVFDWPAVSDMLVAAGGDPELEDSHGETGLFYGCRNDLYNLVVASLDYCVDPLRQNKLGEMPIHVMPSKRKKEFVHLLVQAMLQKVSHNHELAFFANYVEDKVQEVSAKSSR